MKLPPPGSFAGLCFLWVAGRASPRQEGGPRRPRETFGLEDLRGRGGRGNAAMTGEGASLKTASQVGRFSWSPLVHHVQSVGPRSPVSAWRSARGTLEAQATVAAREGGQRAGADFVFRIEINAAEDDAKSGPHAAIVFLSEVGGLGRRHRAQEVICAGRSAEHEHQPCALGVGHPPNAVQQGLLVVEPVGQVGLDESAGAHGTA